MASFKLVHLCFTAVLLCVAFSCCRGQGGGGGGAGAGAGAGGGGGSGIGAVVPGTQDSVQIVAQAALCFDNRPVLTGCLQAMGINASSGTGASMPPPAPGGAATAIMCSPPCFGHVTMMMSCVNAIFGNFVSYNPGLMQGVQAVFQMSCGNVNGPGGAGGAPGGGMGGGPAGNAGGASGGVGGGAAGGIPNGIGGPGGIPNSMGGAAGGGGGTSGASGGGASGTTNTIGGAAGGGAGGTSGGAGGGNDTTNGGAATGAIGSGNITSVSPNAGSHVAVSNQSQPTSGADGPTLSLKGGCSSAVLAIWAGAWLVLF
ncbi:glycine-rich cell wall structural protein 1-like [Triticum urartu]|uniref:DUF7731 domain-containing protein n=1 Tax=Triticum urartu TaxID=4572 RepID=A0A8R7NZW9_TRIUA|nr:glycine-rich cell wall structural protein 1-like [Triticum urartu]